MYRIEITYRGQFKMILQASTNRTAAFVACKELQAMLREGYTAAVVTPEGERLAVTMIVDDDDDQFVR